MAKTLSSAKRSPNGCSSCGARRTHKSASCCKRRARPRSAAPAEMNARGLLTALLRRPGVRLSLLTVAHLALRVQGGVFVLLFVLPLYAALATFTVIELMREWRHGVRRAVWQEAQGQYYAY